MLYIEVSDFVDKFSEVLQDKKQVIRQGLDQEVGLETEHELKDIFQELYTPTSLDNLQDDFRVLATDAGRNDIEMKNNTKIYIVQAATVDTETGISKSLNLNSVKSYKQRDYEKFMQRASELEELKSILEALERKPVDEKTFILIDGTLLTRLLTVPKPLDISENRHIRLQLMKKFGELLNHAENNQNITLAGISKDSNSSILYRNIIGDLIEQSINELDVGKLQSVGQEDKNFLLNNYEKIKYNPQEIRKSLENFESSEANDKKIQDIKALIDRYRLHVSDTEVIEGMASKSGFTKPLRVGRIKPDFFSSIEQFQRKGDRYLKKEFPQVYSEKGDEFVQKHNEALERIAEAPGVVSTYWKPSETDSALRIDVLNHDMDGTKLMNCKEQKFVEPNDKIKELLRLLKTGYAGEGMHNVWISQADNSASLKNKDVEKIYKPILSKQLDINLRNYMRRRDKRA